MKKKLIIIISIILINILFINIDFASSLQGSADVFLMVIGGCGNGYQEPGEECDGTDGVPEGYVCKEDCTLSPLSAPFLPDVFAGINIYGIYTRISTYEALISWTINKKAYCQLEWGDTQELLDWTIVGIEAKASHRAHLTDLLPSSYYYYRIFCWDDWGHKAKTSVRKFRTKDLVDDIPPANVRDFTAVPFEGNIKLTWINPKDTDFLAVKIMRSEEFYVQSINEGKMIYNGSGEMAIDKDVIPGTRYYYTAFAYDNNFNYASGAIASARVPIEEEVVPEEEILPLPEAPIVEEIPLEMIDFDFLIANDTIELVVAENQFSLLPGTILSIRTLEEKFPQILKSIILTIAPKVGDRVKEAKNYLLRIDKKDKYFKATITAPLKIKDYDVYITILNVENSKLARIEGLIRVVRFGKVSKTEIENELGTPIHAAESNKKTNKSVYAADITIYQEKDGQFKKWEGEQYSQFNPIYSNKSGQYGFLVPNGQYYLKARKYSFFTYNSLSILVTNNIINQDMEIIYIPQLDLGKLLLILLGLLIAYFITRKIIKRKKDEDKTGEGFGFEAIDL